jgi:hypothetical protein
MAEYYRSEPEQIARRLRELGYDEPTVANLRKVFAAAQSGQGNPDMPHRLTLKKILEGTPCRKKTLEHAFRCMGLVPEQIRGSEARTYNIAVLLSGALSYTLDICQGFRRSLDDYLRKTGNRAEYFISFGCLDPMNPATSRGWGTAARWLLQEAGDRGFDYHVAIGTQAAIALRIALGDEFGRRSPFLFLGVTSPISAGLVDREQGRADDRQVAGAAYGNGFVPIATAARSLFPLGGRRLVFVYRRGIPQDDAAADTIRQLQGNGDLRVADEVLATEGWPTLDDLNDPEAVYYSWYTFESMFEDPGACEMLRQRIVFATTRGNVRKFNAAFAGASADDEQIGEIGGEMIGKHIRGEMDWRRENVKVSDVQLWINCDTARNRDLLVEPRAVETAICFGDRERYLDFLSRLRK